MIIVAVIMLLSVVIPPSPAYAWAPRGNVHVLVVCSDTQDAMFANTLAVRGGFNVDILYIGSDLPDDRSRLSDVTYLMQYDEVWIPDLNIGWTYGGRLRRSEINALTEYVKYGGVLIFGLNTYIQDWSQEFDGLFGVRLLRVERSAGEGNGWDIIYKNRTYPYNPAFQEAVVSPYKANVYARYLNGNPAVTISKYGHGVAVLMTFNPVKEVVGYDTSASTLCVGVSNLALSERASPPAIPPLSLFTIKLERLLTNPLYITIILLLLLSILAYYGFLPLGVTAVFAVPLLPFARRLFLRRPYMDVIKAVQSLRGATLAVLSDRMGLNPRRMKFPLALLRLKKKVGFIDLSSFGSGDLLIVAYGQESEGMAAWAIERYPRLVEKVARNPGITIIDLSHGVGMPPYDVLNTMKNLSRYGVVELRKIVVDYEVYPTPALLRWFKE